MIAKRKAARKVQGPVLILDAGDYSMGTAFAAAIRETGGELQLMARMGYDATTFGNHEFDLGPDGTAKAIAVAAKAGRIPAMVVSNTDFRGKTNRFCPVCSISPRKACFAATLVIDAADCASESSECSAKKPSSIPVALPRRSSPIPSRPAREMVKILREREKVDVVIALSHGGMDERERTDASRMARTCSYRRQCQASTWSSALTATPNCPSQSLSMAARPWCKPANMARTLANW